MMMAAKHSVQAGQPLPAEALMELYLEDLLLEVPKDVDVLTQKGAEYIYGKGTK